MTRQHRSRVRLASVASLAILLASVLAGPLAQPAAAQVASIDPVVDSIAASRDWDHTSGYGAVEASRAGMADLIVTAPGGTTWDVAPVDPRRLHAALAALNAGGLGGVQEAAMAAVVDQFMGWDAVSGYRAVEANRAGLV